jgi:hypothetical protein
VTLLPHLGIKAPKLPPPYPAHQADHAEYFQFALRRMTGHALFAGRTTKLPR